MDGEVEDNPPSLLNLLPTAGLVIVVLGSYPGMPEAVSDVDSAENVMFELLSTNGLCLDESSKLLLFLGMGLVLFCCSRSDSSVPMVPLSKVLVSSEGIISSPTNSLCWSSSLTRSSCFDILDASVPRSELRCALLRVPVLEPVLKLEFEPIDRDDVGPLLKFGFGPVLRFVDGPVFRLEFEPILFEGVGWGPRFGFETDFMLVAGPLLRSGFEPAAKDDLEPLLKSGFEPPR